MRENSGERVVVDIGSFCRDAWPLPPAKHPANAPAGQYLTDKIKEFAKAQNEAFPTEPFDQENLLNYINREVPDAPSGDISYLLRSTWWTWKKITELIRQGAITGQPPEKHKTAAITDGILLRGKPTLVDQKRKQVFIIRTHPLDVPLYLHMKVQFYYTVGLSFLYPGWPITIIGCDYHKRQIQRRKYSQEEMEEKSFQHVRERFKAKLIDYAHGE